MTDEKSLSIPTTGGIDLFSDIASEANDIVTSSGGGFSSFPRIYGSIAMNSTKSYPANYTKTVYSKVGKDIVAKTENVQGQRVTERFELKFPKTEETPEVIIYTDKLWVTWAGGPIVTKKMWVPDDQKATSPSLYLCSSPNGEEPREDFIGKKVIDPRTGDPVTIPSTCKACPLAVYQKDNGGFACKFGATLPVHLLAYEHDGEIVPIHSFALLQTLSYNGYRSIYGAKNGKHKGNPYVDLFMGTAVKGADDNFYNVSKVSPTPGVVHPVLVSTAEVATPNKTVYVYSFSVDYERTLNPEDLTQVSELRKALAEEKVIEGLKSSKYSARDTVTEEITEDEDPFA